MKTNQKQKNKGVPRILLLKILFGSDFIDYIKEEVGIENFLKKAFYEVEEEKRKFILEDLRVASFLKKWTVIVQKYKNLFGQSIRDKDAITKLQEQGVLQDDSLYKFRNKLFKSDFKLEKEFLLELEENIKLLDEIDSKISLVLSERDNHLVDSKIW